MEPEKYKIIDTFGLNKDYLGHNKLQWERNDCSFLFNSYPAWGPVGTALLWPRTPTTHMNTPEAGQSSIRLAYNTSISSSYHCNCGATGSNSSDDI